MHLLLTDWGCTKPPWAHQPARSRTGATQWGIAPSHTQLGARTRCRCRNTPVPDRPAPPQKKTQTQQTHSENMTSVGEHTWGHLRTWWFIGWLKCHRWQCPKAQNTPKASCGAFAAPQQTATIKVSVHVSTRGRHGRVSEVSQKHETNRWSRSVKICVYFLRFTHGDHVNGSR